MANNTNHLQQTLADVLDRADKDINENNIAQDSFGLFLSQVNKDIFDYCNKTQQLSQSSINSNTSAFSKLTVEPNKIEYKVFILDDKKYKIIDNKQKTNQFYTVEQLMKQQKLYDFLDKLNQSHPNNQILYMIYRQILHSQSPIEQQINSDQIKNQIIKKSIKVPNSQFTILLAIQKYLKSIHQNIEVIYCKQSSIKTQISMKIISTGFAFHKFKCQQKFSKNAYLPTFQQIITNPKQYQYFIQSYENRVKNNYNIDPSKVKINSISKINNHQKQAFAVQWDTYQPQLILSNQKAKSKIKINPYFNKFYLSINQFDNKGNIMFQKQSKFINSRGKCPYYPPQKCSRFGISVLNKFDSGNNRWLQMNNKQNQWYSAFFGLLNKNSILKILSLLSIQKQQTKTQLQNITISGIRKQLKTKICKNKNQIVGQGIFCTPYMQNALKGTQQIQINGETYVLVFQCRVNPLKVKITQKQQQWMINKFCDIRPYGIILVKKNVKQNYPKPQTRFKKLFSLQWLQQLKNKDFTKDIYI